MYKEDRSIHRMFHIDTNRINSRSGLPEMNKLEEWYENEVIHLELSNVARQEAMAGNDSLRVSKSNKYIYTKTLANTRKEQDKLRQIENILFPEGNINSNKANDVEIVFNALKYGAILITADGSSKRKTGILDHKDELKNALGIIVMSDEEAVEYIQRLIHERDERARKQFDVYGIPLPEWVGND